MKTTQGTLCDDSKKTRLGEHGLYRPERKRRPFTILVCGRDRWALECLIQAKDRGCTSIDTPGPRWSGYVYNLRQLGVDIETINEPHGGAFKGTHGRYRLKSVVVRGKAKHAA